MSVRTPHLPLTILCMALLALFVPAPAHADSVPAWQKQTTDQGCFLYQFDESISGMESDPQPTGYVWSGTCMPGQPISGQGTLYEQVDSRHGSKRYRYIDSTTGRLVNGYFDGPVERRRHEVDAQGQWNPAVDHTGPAPFQVVEYRGSCIASLLNDEYSDYSQCTPNRVDDPIIIPRVAPAYFPLPGAYAGAGDSTVPPTGLPEAPPVPIAPPRLADQTGTTIPQAAPPQPALARIDPAPNAGNGLWNTVPTRTAPASGTRMLADSTNPAKRAQRQQQVAQHQVRQAQQRREREQRRGSGAGGALLGALLQTAATVAIVKHSPDATWALNSLAQSSNAEEANQRLMAGAVTALAGGDAQQVNQALSGSGYPGQLSQDEASQRLVAGTIAALSGGNSQQISQALNGQANTAWTSPMSVANPQLSHQQGATLDQGHVEVFDAPSYSEGYAQVNQASNLPEPMGQRIYDTPGQYAASQGGYITSVASTQQVQDYPQPDAVRCLVKVERDWAFPNAFNVAFRNGCTEDIQIRICLYSTRFNRWDCGTTKAAHMEVMQKHSFSTDGRYAYAACTMPRMKGRYRNGNCGGDPNTQNASLVGLH